jgi:ATP-dependent Clp protease ATP-binding subunit ClpB
LTSNLGAETTAKKLVDAKSKSTHENILAIIKNSFKPEFINRLDEIIVFQRLKKIDMESIVINQLNVLRERLEFRGISLLVSSEAITWLAEKGYEPDFGARPLKRVIQRNLENEIANLILKNKIKDQDSVKVEALDHGLKIRRVS